MGRCNQCRLFISETSQADLYALYTRKLVKKVKKLFSETPPRLILWDDMYRGWNEQDLKKLSLTYPNSEEGQVITDFEACIWNYHGSSNCFQSTVPSPNFDLLNQSFGQVWAASAFKGADGITSNLTDVLSRIRNHDNWLKVFQGQLYPHRNKLAGLVMTGWSRYCHSQNLCELLPMSIPSLCVCL